MKRSIATLFLVAVLALISAFVSAGGPTSSSGRTVAAPPAEFNPISVDSPKPGMADPNQVDRLYGQLRIDYDYRPESNPVSSFSQGAFALTPEAADLALSQAAAAAARLTVATAELEALFGDFEAKKLSSTDFETRSSEALSRIEVFAERIQSDVYLGILDRMLDRKPVHAAPRALSRSRAVLQLRYLAEEIQRGIDSHRQTKRIQATDLLRPNLGSAADSIRQLTKALRNSPPPVAG